MNRGTIVKSSGLSDSDVERNMFYLEQKSLVTLKSVLNTTFIGERITPEGMKVLKEPSVLRKKQISWQMLMQFCIELKMNLVFLYRKLREKYGEQGGKRVFHLS